MEVTLVNESQSLTHQNYPECGVSKNSLLRKDIGKRSRCAYEAKGTDIAPYCKKPKMECTKFLHLRHPRRKQIPDSLAEATKKNVFWMMSHHKSPTRTYLLVEWNSKHFQGSKRMQKIWHLSPINQLLSSDTVVKQQKRKKTSETAKVQNFSEECRKTTILVTYNLAIGEKAIQI